MESYFSLSKQTGNCQKYRQTEDYVKFTLASKEVERMKGAQDVACANKKVFVEETDRDANVTIRQRVMQVIPYCRFCWRAEVLLQSYRGTPCRLVDEPLSIFQSAEFPFCSF